MTAPSIYPPPQIVVTYSGGRFHVDIAGFAGNISADNIDSLVAIVRRWAEDAQEEALS